MTHDRISRLTRDAIKSVRYDKYGLSDGFLSVRYIDMTDGGAWKIAFWLKGDVGAKIQIATPAQATDELIKNRIISEIESNLTRWRELLVS